MHMFVLDADHNDFIKGAEGNMYTFSFSYFPLAPFMLTIWCPTHLKRAIRASKDQTHWLEMSMNQKNVASPCWANSLSSWLQDSYLHTKLPSSVTTLHHLSPANNLPETELQQGFFEDFLGGLGYCTVSILSVGVWLEGKNQYHQKRSQP